MTKKGLQADIDYEIEASRDSILATARQVKERAGRLVAELEEIMRIADQVIEYPDGAMYFPTTLWDGADWSYMPVDIQKLDLAIRSYKQAKMLIQLTGKLHKAE